MRSNSMLLLVLLWHLHLLTFFRVSAASPERPSPPEEAIIAQQFQQTKERILKWEDNNKECTNDDNSKESLQWKDAAELLPMRIDKIQHVPSDEMAGVDKDMIHLCATVAGAVYESDNIGDFRKLLAESNIGKNPKFDDLSVRWFQNGVTFGRRWIPEQLSLDPPTFVGIITGSTLILGWRGTVTVKDMLADADISSVRPWGHLKGLEVQKAYYDMVKHVFLDSHRKDIVNYIQGKYSKRPNQMAKDGTPIKRIILTGHSLGGGLAQVAHLFLRATNPSLAWPSSKWNSLVKACKDVEIKCLAISAPMTTVLNNPSSDAREFLKNAIEPDMRNVVFSADVVPRGYADLPFIDGFVNAFLNDAHGVVTSELAQQLARAFIGLHLKIGEMRGMREQALRYRHVGKLIYYDNPGAAPLLYSDADDAKEQGERRFRDLRYGPEKKVADTALDNHMVLVTPGPGLGKH